MRSAYEQLDKQLTADPYNPARMRVVAGTAGTLGEMLAWNNRLKEGGPLLRRAAELSDQMLEKNRDSQELRRAAGLAYNRYAQWLAHVGNEEHQTWGKKGLEIREYSAKLDPNHDRGQLDWLSSLGRYGDASKAVEIANKLLEKPQKDSELLTEIAQCFAQLSARTEDPTTKQSYQQRAIELLNAALETGFKDLVYLEREIEHEPIRGLPEFQAILAKLRQ